MIINMKSKFKLGDKVFTLIDNEIREGEVVGLTTTDLLLNEREIPIVKGYELQETYIIRFNSSSWCRTNNANLIFSSPEEVIKNIKIKYLNE